MKLNVLVLIACLFMFQSCDESAAPNRDTILTVNITEDFNDFNDMWIFVSDEAGLVLDISKFVPASTVLLAAPDAPALLNVTVYSQSGAFHNFTTYAAIPTGSEITLNNSPGGSEPILEIGKASILLQNCPTNATINLSDGKSIAQFQTLDNTSIANQLSLNRAVSDILVTSHRSFEEPVYQWVNRISAGQEYVIDFTTLSAFPKHVSVSATRNVAAVISGIKNTQPGLSYLMSISNLSQPSSESFSAKFGYLNGYDKYGASISTSATFETLSRSVTYVKNGPSLPETVSLPENLLEIQNETITNYSLAFNSSFTYAIHQWEQNITTSNPLTINWKVMTSPGQTPRIIDIPTEIKELHPALSLSNMTYRSSQFYQHLDNQSYDQILTNTLSGNAPSESEYFLTVFSKR